MKVRLRLDHGLVVFLGISLGLIWLVGEQASANAQLLDADPLVPLGGGGIIAITVAIIFVNALFVAAETAVDLLRSIHVRHVKEENRLKSDRLQDLIDHKQRYATACTLGSRIARVLMMLMIILLAYNYGFDGMKGTVVDFQLAHFLLNVLIVALPVGLINLVAGELAPKSFASLHPHRTGLRLYGLIRFAAVIFSIPASILVGIANLVTRTFGGKASFTLPNQAEEEIRTIVESAEESGEIEDDEKRLLTSVFAFTDTVAREVMTPRVDVDAMPVHSQSSELLQLMRDTGHSRIPLFEETDDQIVGIVHAKDLLMAMIGDRDVDVRSLMRPATFVPEGKNLNELLREMRQTRSQMAVVQDEFGGTAGIVTIEDIVEELVGDIVDEYDTDEPEVVESETGAFLVEGKTHLDDVNDEIGSAFESEEFDTIGGYVFGLFGRQPKLGDDINDDPYRFTIVETDGRRISKLKIEPITNEQSVPTPSSSEDH